MPQPAPETELKAANTFDEGAVEQEKSRAINIWFLSNLLLPFALVIAVAVGSGRVLASVLLLLLPVTNLYSCWLLSAFRQNPTPMRRALYFIALLAGNFCVNLAVIFVGCLMFAKMPG